jgi:colanic acid/amylovoran biosynthesis glycosyltransferase
VGRLIEKKGQIHLLRALAELRTRRPGLAFTLDLVGDGPDAALLRAEASQLTLDPCVRFHGSLPHKQVLALLESASIFVLPSVTASDGDMEGIPVALMEAMAQGLPVISTRHSGIPELVEEDVSGLLVPERDPLALSRAIETLLAAPETWPLYGAAGRRRVEAAFERKELDRTLRELYVRILPGRHAVAQAEG